MIILFWTLMIVTGFAIALAAQMRMLASIALRRALAAKFGGTQNDSDYVAAVFTAGRPGLKTTYTEYLETAYPRPVSHLTLARRISLAGPIVLLLIVFWGRFGLGAF